MLRFHCLQVRPARSWPHNRRLQVSVPEPIRFWRSANDLDLLWKQVRQYATHSVGGQCQLVECDVGNDNDKQSLPNLFKEANALDLEFLVETSPEHGRIR